MTPRLDEIKARLAAATKGPWRMLYAFGSKDLPSSIVHGDKSETVLDWTSASDSSNADVELCANAPADLAWLIEEAERLMIWSSDSHIQDVSEENAKLRAELDEECRLLGAGGSRELALMTERDKLRADLDVACEGLGLIQNGGVAPGTFATVFDRMLAVCGLATACARKGIFVNSSGMRFSGDMRPRSRTGARKASARKANDDRPI